ncbi:hypothetical protein VPHD148_0161 [Vibrio phage D148]
MNYRYKAFQFSSGKYGVKRQKWWWGPFWNKVNCPVLHSRYYFSGTADETRAFIDRLIKEQNELRGVHK